MPPQNPRPGREPDHEPQAFESDLERHRGSDDEIYGSHGVQPDPAEPPPARPGAGRASLGMSRVGERRRR